MAAYSDDQAEAVANAAEDSAHDASGPYAIGALGNIDFNNNEAPEGDEATANPNVDEYGELAEGESVEQVTKGKKKKDADVVDPNSAGLGGVYKDSVLDAAYESPETDGLAAGYE